MKKSVLLTDDTHSPGLEGPRGDRAKLLSFIVETAGEIWGVGTELLRRPGRAGGQDCADAIRCICEFSDRCSIFYADTTRYLKKHRSAYYHTRKTFPDLYETNPVFRKKADQIWRAVQIREGLLGNDDPSEKD